MTPTGKRPLVAVVDGYSAGNFYPAAFAALGADLVHVQTTPELNPAMAPPVLTRYRENLVSADESELVRRLRESGADCVVAGQESAVQPADRIAGALGVPGNGTALSTARRDKYEMTETLRRAGVPCAPQFRAGTVGEAVEWAEERGAYPVVVKPLSSAGSDGVTVCRDAAQTAAAAEAVLGSPNVFGTANSEVLVQGYLHGTEYIVDTVSCDGDSYVCGVWEYEKTLLPSGRNIYNRDILADPKLSPVPELASYVRQVLDALGIRWGPAHAEVILTADGPVLVEIGARLNGNMDAGFHDVCLGHNQASLTALALLRPAEFRERYAGRVCTRVQPAVVYNAPTALDGVVGSVDGTAVEEIRSLESVHSALVKHAPGSRIRPTTDLFTSALRIHLTAPDEELLRAEYEKTRALKDSVYTLAPAG